MGAAIHVVIGASGGTGSAVVRQLHGAGRTVRAVNRSGRLDAPAGVEVVGADATNAAEMRAACAGADVVYNCVNPPFLHWREAFPAAVDGVLAGAAAADAALVFADDTWMYGRVDGPMTEATPHRPVSNRGVLRAWLAERILAAHQRGDVQAVIGRAGELFGPGVESTLGRNLFGPVLRGRAAHWLGDPDLPLTPMFIEDFARGLIALGERTDAHGSAWHIPNGDALTGREFVGLIAEAAGRRPRLLAHGGRSVRALGLFSAVAREGAEMIYQFEQPFTVDATRFTDAFGEKVTPRDEAVRTTVAWYRTHSTSRVPGR